MAKNEVTLTFAGDAGPLTKTFDQVGAGAKTMGDDVASASKRMSDDSKSAGSTIGDSIGDQESKFQGLASTINGTGDVMEGFKTGNVATMAMGFADLADGLSKAVVPALVFMKTTLMTGLAPALTMISAHPLIAGLIVGGVIIAGLVLLEKKFGVVSTAVGWVKDALTGVWNWVKNNWDDLANILTMPFLGAFRLISKAWNATMGGFGFSVPSWVPVMGGNSFRFPSMPSFSFHQGGVVPGPPGSEVLGVLQAGEEVLTASQRASGGRQVVIHVHGSVIAERDLGRVVADALRQNRLVGVT